MSGAEQKSTSRSLAGPRCIAIVGPFQSGKTTLLEAILERTGALQRAGKVTDGSTVGDSSAEARAHGHGVEPNVATTGFMDERLTFIDCPGSVEFLHDIQGVTPACDAAIVVCEADERKLAALQVVLRDLEEAGIPRFLFLNKIDTRHRQRARVSGHAADRLAHAAAAAPDPDLEERHRDRFHRPRAGARLHLPRARAQRGRRHPRRRDRRRSARPASPCWSGWPTTTTRSWRS